MRPNQRCKLPTHPHPTTNYTENNKKFKKQKAITETLRETNELPKKTYRKYPITKPGGQYNSKSLLGYKCKMKFHIGQKWKS